MAPGTRAGTAVPHGCRPCRGSPSSPTPCLSGGPWRKSCPACLLLEVVAEARPGVGPLQGRGGTEELRHRRARAWEHVETEPRGKERVRLLLEGSVLPSVREGTSHGAWGSTD